MDSRLALFCPGSLVEKAQQRHDGLGEKRQESRGEMRKERTERPKESSGNRSNRRFPKESTASASDKRPRTEKRKPAVHLASPPDLLQQ